jgi:hypothetical protein
MKLFWRSSGLSRDDGCGLFRDGPARPVSPRAHPIFRTLGAISRPHPDGRAGRVMSFPSERIRIQRPFSITEHPKKRSKFLILRPRVFVTGIGRGGPHLIAL